MKIEGNTEKRPRAHLSEYLSNEVHFDGVNHFLGNVGKQSRCMSYNVVLVCNICQKEKKILRFQVKSAMECCIKNFQSYFM